MESYEQKKQRAQQILKKLNKDYPNAKTALHFSTPFQLLIATILSAQCTDARVNMVTPVLFTVYPTARELAKAKRSEVESIIRSTGFFRMKAKNIIAAAQKIVNDYNGEVPCNFEQLLQLPGVGRKTAHCVLGGAYNIAVGIVVDTHVLRLSYRMGLTTHRDPIKVEQDLMKLFPRKDWYTISNLFISHGRAVCLARKPLCNTCSVALLCPKIYYTKRKDIAV